MAILICLIAFLTSTVHAALPPKTALHLEADGLTERGVGCGLQERCSVRHRNPLLQPPPGLLDLKTFTTAPCFCDKECFEFGDCCVDILEVPKESCPGCEDGTLIVPQLTRGLPRNFWECLPFADLEQSNHQILTQYAWMVSYCENSLHEESKECNKRAEEKGYTYVHDVPMLVEGTLYRNIFCASCHGHQMEMMQPLNMSLVCTKNVTIDQVSDETYQPGKLRWQMPNEEGNCFLRVHEYQDMKALNLNLKDEGLPMVRQCRSNIASCPPDWTDIAVRTKCAAYSLSVMYQDKESQREYMYMNPHCGVCHGAKNMSCHLTVGARTSGHFVASFSIIFHFSLGGGDVVGHDACTRDFVWDGLNRRCRPVRSCGNDPAEECPGTTDDVYSSSMCDHQVQYTQFTVLENGSLMVNGSDELYEPSMYQIIKNKAEVCSNSASLLEGHDSGGASSFSDIESLLALVCTVVSMLGLTLHIMVMVTLPRLRNLPGLISLATSCALLLAQMLFLWSASVFRPEAQMPCILLAAFLHFCLLHVFAWTSVMSYDIWRTFTHPTGHLPGRRSNSRLPQFARYFAFAFSVPTIIVSISLLLNSSDAMLVLSPRYAQGSVCWIGSRLGLAVLFATPVSLMLMANIALYGIVVLRIREQRRASSYLVELNRREEQHSLAKSGHHSPRYSENDCKLHFSIFNVMGGTWILGILAGLVDHPILWYTFIFLNGSQGALIFILQIIKPRVWEMLRNRLSGRDELQSASSRTPNTMTTPASGGSLSVKTGLA